MCVCSEDKSLAKDGTTRCFVRFNLAMHGLDSRGARSMTRDSRLTHPSHSEKYSLKYATQASMTQKVKSDSSFLGDVSSGQLPSKKLNN